LILPFIQSTTPAYLFALSLLLPPVTFFVMRLDKGVAFYRHLLFLTFCFIAFTATAQFALAGSGIRHLTGITLIKNHASLTAGVAYLTLEIAAGRISSKTSAGFYCGEYSYARSHA
jgi:hypothetical protein